MSGYKDSWIYIAQGRHSLERHCNLGLALQEAFETADTGEKTFELTDA